MRYLMVRNEMSNYDVIIVGAGFAGATVAQQCAEKGRKVLVIEKRKHIGGNAYDYMLDGIDVHAYGPHIFHTNNKEVFEYLKRFGDFYPYEHRVLGHIQDKLVPIPFNLKSIELCFDEKIANELKEVLIKEYGMGNKVPIMELRKNNNPQVHMLADFIFANVFKYYTMKQWGLKAEEIDPAVTARVPVNVSYDDRYFNDQYQYMPLNGYTALFEEMLKDDSIDILLNTDAKDHIDLDLDKGKIYYRGKEFIGKLVYTGALDELLDYKLGELPYRSLDLVLEKHQGTFQKAATENYPGNIETYPYTRITEYKLFKETYPQDYTYTHTEYPLAYKRDGQKGNIPYYPIFTNENDKKYKAYVNELKNFHNLYLLGRLAEYHYYNMDAIIAKALELVCKL